MKIINNNKISKKKNIYIIKINTYYKHDNQKLASKIYKIKIIYIYKLIKTTYDILLSGAKIMKLDGV